MWERDKVPKVQSNDNGYEKDDDDDDDDNVGDDDNGDESGGWLTMIVMTI